MAEIALRNGGVTLVDDADYEWLARYAWSGYVMKSGLRYVMTDVDGERIYMHRLIIGAGPDKEVDHRNGTPLDNQRHNLREVTHQQNQQNRRNGYGATGYRNVYRLRSGRYHVKLVIDRKARSFGAYDTIEEAAIVARRARLEHMPYSDESATEIVVDLPEWRPCPTAPGYFATRGGRVRNSHGEQLKLIRGRLKVRIELNGKRTERAIAKLVATAFGNDD